MLISENIQAIKASATLEITAKAKELKAAGQDIISLSIGEPDFHTPPAGKAAAYKAIDLEDDDYPPPNGKPALLKAISAKLKKENSLDYNPEEIIISNGAKQVLFNAFFVLLNKGDEVLLPAPYWVSYADIAKIAGGIPVTVPSNKDLSLNISELENRITDKTKILVLNSPNNPSGSCYSKEELLQVAELLRKHTNIIIISDDIYEHIIYDGAKFYNILELAPDLKNRVIIVNGVSKCYAMTGWRVGYGACSNKEIMKFISILQMQSTGGICAVAQAAALGVLTGEQSFLVDRTEVFKKRRDKALEILSKASGLTCSKPGGAFYLFPSCEKLIGRKTSEGKIIEDDVTFVKYLLEKYFIAVVPGVEFGMPGYFRISYALNDKLLEQACQRIVEAYNSIA